MYARSPGERVLPISESAAMAQLYLQVWSLTEYQHRFRSRDELASAVMAWSSDKTEAVITYGNIGFWDVRNVTDMQDLFNGMTTFDANLNAWDVSAVTDMRRMFRNAHAFSSDLESWQVSRVQNMQVHSPPSLSPPFSAFDARHLT